MVIATRNRPNHVTELVETLAVQDLKPAGIVVVDSSEEHLESSPQTPPGSNIPVLLERVEQASLPYQRNVGSSMALASFEPDAICFLDDDVRPRLDYLSRLANLLLHDTVNAVGGVSGTSGWTRASSRASHRAFNRLFLLYGPADGRVLRSGYNMPADSRREGIHTVQWLFGCSMWRADVLRRYRFNESLVGSGLFEDVEFSVRVARHHTLLVDSSARLEHLLEMDQRPSLGLHYERLVRNRAEVIKAMETGLIGWLAFWWSVAGDAALLARYAHSSKDYRERLAGLLRGVAATAARRPPR